MRGDKTTAGNGLEISIPFFDKEFVKAYMHIEPSLKMVREGFEKYLLRELLKQCYLKRLCGEEKDGFSDGVSKGERPWYKIIEEYTQSKFGLS